MSNGLDEFLAKMDKIQSISNPKIPVDVRNKREKNALILAESGWSLVPGLTFEQVDSLASGDYSESEISETMATFYDQADSEQLRALVSKTICSTQHFARWGDLLRECMESYISGRYLVAIPALLSVVEGSLAKALDTIDTKNVKLIAITKDRIEEAEMSPDSATGITAANWKTISMAVNTLFIKSDFTGEQPYTLNRHWWVHGRSVPQGEEKVENLKLFNLLGSIAMECSSVEDHLSSFGLN